MPVGGFFLVFGPPSTSDAKCLSLEEWKVGVKQALLDDISDFFVNYPSTHSLHTVPWVPDHPPHTFLHPCPPPTAFTPLLPTVPEADETLSPWLHQALASAVPSQQNGGTDMTNLSAAPAAQPALGVPDACPESWWLQRSVGVRGQLRASELCNEGGKWAARFSSVAGGGDSTSYICAPTSWIFLRECGPLPPQPREPRPLASGGAGCRSLEIKTHPPPLVPHQTPKVFTLQNRLLWAFY